MFFLTGEQVFLHTDRNIQAAAARLKMRCQLLLVSGGGHAVGHVTQQVKVRLKARRP